MRSCTRDRRFTKGCLVALAKSRVVPIIDSIKVSWKATRGTKKVVQYPASPTVGMAGLSGSCTVNASPSVGRCSCNATNALSFFFSRQEQAQAQEQFRHPQGSPIARDL
jgi:hypothetical protein